MILRQQLSQTEEFISQHLTSFENMGDPSFLRYVPASCATVPIDWTKVPQASREFLLQGWGTDWSTKKTKKRSLPKTINGLAEMFDESKFFGYMTSEHYTLLFDISEFGLQAHAHTGLREVGPRFYMKYLSQVWFILFIPGERDGVIGYSANVDRLSDESDEGAIFGRERAVAEAYDPKLCEEFHHLGQLMAITSKNMAGWDAFTLKSSLQLVQMADAMLALPSDHPAHVAFTNSYFQYFGPFRR